MLSPATQRELIRLQEYQDAYRPNEATRQALRHLSLTATVGAAATGKSTIMRTAAKLDPAFAQAGTFVSRPSRRDDTGKIFDYYPHTDAGLRPLLDRIRRRQVVQYHINEHTGHIYGSELHHYAAEHNMLDIWSSAIPHFRALNFGSFRIATIVTDPQTWLRQFDERFPAGHPLRTGRLDEAVESLSWSLQQTGPDHVWLKNVPGHSEQAAGKLMAFAREEAFVDDHAQLLGHYCLEAAFALRAQQA